MIGEGADKVLEYGFALGGGGVRRQTDDATGGVAPHAPREEVTSVVRDVVGMLEAITHDLRRDVQEE